LAVAAAAFQMAVTAGLFGQIGPNSSSAPIPASLATFAEKEYLDARNRFRTNVLNADLAWQLGRACFEWWEFLTNDTARATIANEGIAVCRALVGRQSTNAAGHYYLALNLGRLADTRRNLSAMKLVDEMETEFKLTAGLDPKFDFAGPDRGLGNLYLGAPGWPVSVGSKSRARTHLRRAVELCPEFPENQLCLIEAYLKWGEKKSAQPMLATIDKVLEKARSQFTGETWANAWRDWNQRWKKIKERLR
jgi:hypothetical protein